MSIRIFPPWKRVKKYGWAIFIIVLLKIPWVWFAQRCDAREDILNRRAYLVVKVQGGDAQGPSFLPSQFRGEWELGTYSMLSAALTNIAYIYPETREESRRIVRSLIERVLLPEIKQFDFARWGEDPLDTLSGTNGHIGYLGHLNWMLGAYKFLGGEGEFDRLFESISAALARRLTESPGFCLETYPDEALYMPDNIVVMASLANYSHLYNGVYDELVNKWVAYAKQNWLDRDLGLLPFHLDNSCRSLGGARGSGAGWNSFYLPFIDIGFANEQFLALKQHLIQTRIITGVREYPPGVFGLGDVDSGPVIFGFSPSGTGFAVGGATHAGDTDLVNQLLFTSELVGSSVQWHGQRFYLLAPTVGEAIILAMKTARVWKR